MQWTSIVAYWEIYDDLPDMRRETLVALLRYVNQHGRAPTGQELEFYARSNGMNTAGISAGRLKRLSELADLVNAIHRTEARRCSVTGHLALTWTPGPIPGTELGTPIPDEGLRRRLKKLRLVAMNGVSFEDAKFILNAVETKLQAVWNEDGTIAMTQADLFDGK